MAGKMQSRTEEDELDFLLTTIFHAEVKMEQRIPRTESVKQRMDFLEAMVSGRGMKSPQFRDWFPDISCEGLGSGMLWLRQQTEGPMWKNMSVSRIIPNDNLQQASETFSAIGSALFGTEQSQERTRRLPLFACVRTREGCSTSSTAHTVNAGANPTRRHGYSKLYTRSFYS